MLLKNSLKPTKLFYAKLVKPIVETPTAQKKWNNLFPLLTQKDWNFFYSLPFKITNSTKLQIVQFKFLHRIIPTRHLLKIMGIVDDTSCRFCKESEETLSHVFFDCAITNDFLKKVSSILEHLCTHIVLPVEKQIILFGIPTINSNRVQNNIILLLKNYLYSLLMQQKLPTVEGFRN